MFTLMISSCVRLIQMLLMVQFILLIILVCILCFYIYVLFDFMITEFKYLEWLLLNFNEISTIYYRYIY